MRCESNPGLVSGQLALRAIFFGRLVRVFCGRKHQRTVAFQHADAHARDPRMREAFWSAVGEGRGHTPVFHPLAFHPPSSVVAARGALGVSRFTIAASVAFRRLPPCEPPRNSLNFRVLDIKLIREKTQLVCLRLATRGAGDESKIDELLKWMNNAANP